jgi:hypothetical protein
MSDSPWELPSEDDLHDEIDQLQDEVAQLREALTPELLQAADEGGADTTNLRAALGDINHE